MWQWSNVKSISNPKRPSSGKDKKARACYSLEAVQICSTDFECTCFNLGTSVLVICICLALCGIGVLPFHSPTPTALNEIGCMMAAIYSGCAGLIQDKCDKCPHFCFEPSDHSPNSILTRRGSQPRGCAKTLRRAFCMSGFRLLTEFWTGGRFA